MRLPIDWLQRLLSRENLWGNIVLSYSDFFIDLYRGFGAALDLSGFLDVSE